MTLPLKGPNCSLEEIIQSSKTTVLLEDGHLKILIDIPLLEKPDYILYKLHPFPVFQQIYGNITGRVSINSPYTNILIDDPLRTYMLVKEGELNSCKQFTDYLLCQNSLPMSSRLIIQGLGLMQLAPGCHANTPYSIIPAIPKIQGITELIYESEIGIRIDYLAPKIASYKTSQEELKLVFPESKGFYKTSQSLDELEQKLHEFSLQQMEKGYR